jgi:dTDP-glucose 4,6-dehydratase
VPLYGDGRNVRGRVHVDDHCRGIHLVLEQGRPGCVHHISRDAEPSNLELARVLLDRCGAGWDMVRQVADRKGHDFRYRLDDTRLRGLGCAPQIPLSQGLADTVRWYADNRDWWEPLKRGGPGGRQE